MRRKPTKNEFDTLRAEVEALKKALGAQAAEEEKKKPVSHWHDTKKTCPHCGREKRVEPDFGVRTVRGIESPQPWCRECRNGENYHNKPRKNRSKNWPGPGK